MYHTFTKTLTMTNNLLLPHKFKRIGWLILLPSTIGGLILLLTGVEDIPLKTTVFAVRYEPFMGTDQSFQFIHTDISGTLVGILFLIGALLVGFSREKNEDEFIEQLRLSSLLWAVLLNYTLLLVAFAFVYGMAFLTVMLYNMFTVLAIFILRFNYLLYRNAKSAPDEKQH